MKQFLFMILLLSGISLQVCAAGSTSVHIPVASETEQVKETFTYVLESEDEEVDRIQIEAGEAAGFTVSVTEPGVQTYTVYQMAGTDSQVIYDDTIYCVDVHTVMEDDGLHSEPVIYVRNTANKVAQCRFVNQKPLSEEQTVPEIGQMEVPETKPSVWEQAVEIIKTGEISDLRLNFCLTVISVIGILYSFLLWRVRVKRKKDEG